VAASAVCGGTKNTRGLQLDVGGTGCAAGGGAAAPKHEADACAEADSEADAEAKATAAAESAALQGMTRLVRHAGALLLSLARQNEQAPSVLVPALMLLLEQAGVPLAHSPSPAAEAEAAAAAAAWEADASTDVDSLRQPPGAVGTCARPAPDPAPVVRSCGCSWLSLFLSGAVVVPACFVTGAYMHPRALRHVVSALSSEPGEAIGQCSAVADARSVAVVLLAAQCGSRSCRPLADVPHEPVVTGQPATAGASQRSATHPPTTP
jgi:hypothetical protein